MSLPTTGIKLNSVAPAPPADKQNMVFVSDGGTPQQQVTAIDPVMVGDTGSGGKAGNVPAAPAGAGAAHYVLKADGTWGPPMTSGPGSTHSESLTDGNANFIFDATLSKAGDIITVCGVPN